MGMVGRIMAMHMAPGLVVLSIVIVMGVTMVCSGLPDSVRCMPVLLGL